MKQAADRDERLIKQVIADQAQRVRGSVRLECRHTADVVASPVRAREKQKFSQKNLSRFFLPFRR